MDREELLAEWVEQGCPEDDQGRPYLEVSLAGIPRTEIEKFRTEYLRRTRGIIL